MFVYGCSEISLPIRIINQDLTMLKQITASLVFNTASYLIRKLKLPKEQLFIYSKSEKQAKFDYLTNFELKHLSEFSQELSILILYSDTDLVTNTSLQSFVIQLFSQIFENGILVNQTTNKIKTENLGFVSNENEDWTTGGGHLPAENSLRINLESSSNFILTDDVAVAGNAILLNNHPVYCKSPETLPFSYAKAHLKAKHKLDSPPYFTREFLSQRYNSKTQIIVDDMLRGIFEINKDNEVILVNKDMIKNVKGVFPDIIKQAAYLILTGQGVFKIQLPIRIFETKSQVFSSAEFFSNFEFLHKACETGNSLDKFKFLIVFAVSNFIYRPFSGKPYNPLLGETFQGTYADGTKAYAEHITHEPPITLIYLVNEEQQFKLHVRMSIEVSFKPSEVRFNYKCVVHVEIKDDKFSYTFPIVVARGMFSGNRRMSMEGTMFFHYPKKNWKAYVTFGAPNKNGELSGLICVDDNVLGSNVSILGSNLFSNFKKIKQPSDQVLAEISGCWLRNIVIDGKEIWNKDMSSYPLYVDENVLPSDSRFREDLIWHIKGMNELAQQWKYKLEKVQRKYQKLRENFRKKNKKNK